MALGAFLAALSLGFRHGIDWDHIAAITDLTSSAPSRRRGFVLSMVYAVGHAVVVFLLGAGLIVFGASLPAAADEWMGLVVGLSLVALGLWVVVELVRRGRDFRLRSRWILILHGTFAGLRRVRRTRSSRVVSVEHEHDHEHIDEDHAGRHAHDHAHTHASVDTPTVVPVGAGGPVTERRSWPWMPSGKRHSHRHRHDLRLPEQPTARYGTGTAVGVGVLHGVGVESPTQIAVFVAASSATGMAGGLALLGAWVVGLVAANAALAAGAGAGLLRAESNFVLYATVAVVAAALSIALGLSLITGVGGLPDIAT